MLWELGTTFLLCFTCWLFVSVTQVTPRIHYSSCSITEVACQPNVNWLIDWYFYLSFCATCMCWPLVLKHSHFNFFSSLFGKGNCWCVLPLTSEHVKPQQKPVFVMAFFFTVTLSAPSGTPSCPLQLFYGWFEVMCTLTDCIHIISGRWLIIELIYLF